MSETKPLVIFMTDIRAASMCSRGARAFFIRNNLDWSDFLKNGIEGEKLSGTGDAMAIRVVEVARGRKQQ